jgi:hypothetical protein
VLSTRRIWRVPILAASICAGLAFAGAPAAHADSPAPHTGPQAATTRIGTSRGAARPVATHASAPAARAKPTATTKKTTTAKKATPAKTTTKKATAAKKATPAKTTTTKKAATTKSSSASTKAKSTASAKSPAPAKSTAQVEHGIAMHYYPGLFATVARNRGMTLRKDVDGYASRQSCSELGRVVQARIRNPWTGAWGPWKRYQIVDCSARKHLVYQRSIGLILEVDYASAAKAGFVFFGRSAVEVKR